jgi:hypothetical protein
MKLRCALLFVAALGASTLVARAQSVDEVLQRYFESVGGLQKLKSVQSMKVTADLSTQGMDMVFVSHYKRPNRVRTEAEFMEMSMVQVFNEGTAWQIMPPSTVAEQMPPDQAALMAETADIDGHLVDHQEKGYEITLEGNDGAGEQEFVRLRVEVEEGSERIYHLDRSTYLPARMEIRAPGVPPGTEYLISDYREVDGLMFGHHIEHKVSGYTAMTINVTSIELNVPMAEEMFGKP